MLPVAYWRLLGPMAAMKRHPPVRLVICDDLPRAAHVQPRRFGEAAGELMSRFQANNLLNDAERGACECAWAHRRARMLRANMDSVCKSRGCRQCLHPALLEIQ